MSRVVRNAGLVGLLVAVVAGACAGSAVAVTGPKGISRDKVLVIGIDGTRWDLLDQAMRDGRAPNLRSLARQGFATATLLAYQPPEAYTMSQVGWSTIASGVWPDKHGVTDLSNTSPGQATKNGYLDFLTRLERANHRFSTFAVADWSNLLEHRNGGPIFGDAIDVKLGTEPTDTDYATADQADADLAARYLRTGNPDAGFVYLGNVDETAHLAGSATPAYAAAIATADRQVGEVLRAVRARRTYHRERWTFLVTTDHGQRALDIPALASHGGGSTIERTSFVIAAGPGIPPRATPATARVVDVAPTVLHQLHVRIKPAWRLDGRSLARR